MNFYRKLAATAGTMLLLVVAAILYYPASPAETFMGMRIATFSTGR